LRRKLSKCGSKKALKKKTFAIQWTELLSITAETPFESLSELVPGKEVLAPYYDSGDKINYSLAVITGRGKKDGENVLCRQKMLICIWMSVDNWAGYSSLR